MSKPLNCAGWALAVLLTGALCLPFEAAWAADYSVLHVFLKRGTDGKYPHSDLLLDKSGNLYGTTSMGGTSGRGMVFRIAPGGSETFLHSFIFGTDGATPIGGLIIDGTGNLYGTTYDGGPSQQSRGVVYELAPDGTETVLHDFHDAGDGAYPYFGKLLRDAAGNLYGTTSLGGTADLGTVFKLAPNGAETVLHSFTGGAGDGTFAYSGLVADPAGNFYGTTSEGGAFDGGIVYELTPDGTLTILHSFGGGGDGANPTSTLLREKSGVLYGTTVNGGAFNLGTVFRLKPNGRETVLHSFGSGADGSHPYGGVVRGAGRNLYGMTGNGGGTGCLDGEGCGTVFSLAPDGTETVLHAFTGKTDGALPYAGLIKDRAGNLYGDTYQCCNRGDNGTVFKIAP